MCYLMLYFTMTETQIKQLHAYTVTNCDTPHLVLLRFGLQALQLLLTTCFVNKQTI